MNDKSTSEALRKHFGSGSEVARVNRYGLSKYRDGVVEALRETVFEITQGVPPKSIHEHYFFQVLHLEFLEIGVVCRPIKVLQIPARLLSDSLYITREATVNVHTLTKSVLKKALEQLIGITVRRIDDHIKSRRAEAAMYDMFIVARIYSVEMEPGNGQIYRLKFTNEVFLDSIIPF